VVLDTLSELTSSAVLFPSLQGLYMVIGQREQPGADSISFVTSSEVLLPPREAAVAGLRRVTISLQRDDQGNPYLALQNSPALTPADSTTEAELHVLSADVTGFAVRYRHPQDGDWRDTWEERDVMPAAIEYTIAFGGADGRTEPLLVTRAIDLPTAEGALLTMGDR
jgi:hypothetical protein